MFTEYNRDFIADQRHGSGLGDHPMAVHGAAQVLTDVGMGAPALPYYFRIDPATYDTLAQATRTLVRAQEKLLRHLSSTLTAEELVTMFQVPAAMAACIDWPDIASAGLRMLRADIIPTDSGYHFCELNHFSGVGGAEAYHSARTLAELLGRPVSGVSPFRQIAYAYIAACQRAGLTRIVILDTPGHDALGHGRHVMLRDYLRLMAPELEVAYHHESTYPARWLEPTQARRTLIHRLITFDDTTDSGAFLAKLRERGATFSCLYEAELKMHRKWLALLWDPHYQPLLDEAERAVIASHVPYGFVLGPDNLESAVADKDELVFKRSYSYGGQGVILGDQYPADKLRAILTEDTSAWVCQRRVVTSTLDLPVTGGSAEKFYFVLGMYLYGEEASGLLVRAAPGSAVVNVGQGGGMSWAFVA